MEVPTTEVPTTHAPQQGAALTKRTTKYVGLDVHQSTTVAVVRDDTGRVIASRILATEEAALLEFFRGLRGAVHVALEEGTQAHWLGELLTPQLIEPLTLTPIHGTVADAPA